jgi:ABC-type transport system involved in cytochrome c biogenesis ATPase subunit
MSSCIQVADRLSESKRAVVENFLRGYLAQASQLGAVIRPKRSAALAPLSLAQDQLWLRDQDSARLPRRQAFTFATAGYSVFELCLLAKILAAAEGVS